MVGFIHARSRSTGSQRNAARKIRKSRRARLETLEQRHLLAASWLDVDINDSTDPLSDGILFIRHFAQFTGTALTDAAVDPGGDRTDADEIDRSLRDLVQSGRLDIDKNGETEPLSDGILILRYLAEFRGEALIADAVQANAERNTAPLIEAHLQRLEESGALGLFTLEETSGYATTESVTDVPVGADQGTRTVSVKLDMDFDYADGEPVVKDLLQIYVVDPSDSSQTLLDRGENGTAVFSLGESGADYQPGVVRFDGQTVEIDVTNIPAGTANLDFQFLNNDLDNTSRITVLSVDHVTDEDALSSPVLPPSNNLTDQGPDVDTSTWVSTEEVAVEVENVRYDSVLGQYEAELRAVNDGLPTTGNIALSFPGLPDGVTIENASGTVGEDPFLNLAPAVPRGGLVMGTQSGNIPIRISNPGGERIRLVPTVLAGPANRPPELSELDVLTVNPGDTLEVQLPATDPDGDEITYALDSEVELPPGMLTPDGKLYFSPAPDDIGQYNFDVIASDGAEQTSQPVELQVVADPVTTTRVSGVILNTLSEPLASVPIELGDVQTTTAADGTFTVETSVAFTDDTLIVRGEAISGAETYPYIAEKLHLVLGHGLYEGVNNRIMRPIYLPALDIANAQPINPNDDTTVTVQVREDEMPVEVFVAEGTLMDQDNNPYAGALSVTEVPPDLTPAALPPNLRPDLVLTIQPGEMNFTQPAPITFPNTAGYAIGTILNLWSINPVTGEFDDVGDMEVIDDPDNPGETIIQTISGGIVNSSWHFPAPPDPEPEPDDDADEDNDCEECKETAGNFEVELHSGAVLEDHLLVSYQSIGQTQGFGLHYDSLRADPRPIVHINYSNLVPRDDQRLVASLDFMNGDFQFVLPGYEGDLGGLNGGEHFWDVDVTGTGRVALQADFTMLPSGVYTYNLTSGPLQFDGEQFAGTTTTQTKELRLVNTINSPFGAGWGLTGLWELVENADGSVLLIDGGGSELYFAAAATEGEPLVSPPGDFTKLVKQLDGTYQRTTTDQTVYLFNANHQVASMTDRNGNVWIFSYDANNIISRIIDPAGLETRFATTDGRVTSITDPADRVTVLEYDEAGNLTRITDPDQTTRSWDYDDSHHIISHTDKRGLTEEVFYDFAGRAERSIRKDGTEQFYDPVQTQVLLPVEQTTDPFNSPLVSALTEISGRYVDPNGNVTEVQLDKQGQARRRTDPEGNLGGIVRNDDNLVTMSSDGRGFPTDLTYDDNGNVLTVTESVPAFGSGNVALLPYDPPNDALIRDNSGFSTSSLAPNDDNSTSQVPIGFDVNFFGDTYSEVYVNNNGNVTFDSSQSTFTPFDLLSTQRVIIAPFFADVDTRGTGTVTYGMDTVLGQSAFAVTWDAVGYFNSQTDRTNTFQLVIVDRSDVEPGAFDFEFNYLDINWETGGASGGAGGLGGNSARAGYSNGSNAAFEIPGSAINGAFLDDNQATGLIYGNRNSRFDGRYRFEVRGGEVLAARTQYTYDDQFSQITAITDELGRQTLHDLEPATGNLLQQTRVIGELDDDLNGETDDLVTVMTYTQFGLVDTVTDPLGRVTDYDYDARGLLTSVTHALGTPDEATTTFEYDAAGNRTAMIDGESNRTEYVYDELNRLIRTVQQDPDGAGLLASPITSITYDPSGNVETVTDANQNTTSNRYDELDRLIESISPDPDNAGPLRAPVTTYAYDPAGNLSSMTDPNGHVTSYRYDGRNRQVSMTDPDGGITSFGYDNDNNPTLVIDPVDNVTRFNYDARNRLVAEIDPFNNSIVYAYDGANNLIRKTDRNERVTSYTYDDVNRLLTEEWLATDESVVNTITYTYDADSNLLSLADNQSALTFTYDARDRVQTVDNIGTPGVPNVVLTYTYDDVGNVLSVTDTIDANPGATTGYQYDGLNRLISLNQSGTDTSDKRVDFTYNPLGQYTAIDRFSDLAGTQLVIGTDYTYDAQNRLVRLDHQNSDGASVAFYDYVYDTESRITQITDVDGITTYGYDDRDQLTAADYSDAARTDETYLYDANGNRIESSLHGNGYVTDLANRLTSDGTYNYEYDNEGNMTRRTRITGTEADGSTVREFMWDHRNRLTAVIDKQADGIVSQEVKFMYDAIDRRISKSVDDTPTNGISAELTHFVYDRENVILDVIDVDGEGSNAPVLDKRYLHAAEIDHVLVLENDDTRWLLQDHLGSTRALVDDSGVATNHFAYNSQGTVEFGNISTSRYLFTGREYDENIGLYYYRSRYYLDTIGRFLSEDLVGFNGGALNLYVYVFNRPVEFVDPNGLEGYARFCKRPLQGTPWIPVASNNPLDDWLNTEISHEQIVFFDDEGNPIDDLGFFDDNTVRPEDEFDFSDFRTCGEKFDSDKLRDAASQTQPRDYNLIPWFGGDNCQSWAENVRDQYFQNLGNR